MWLVAKSSHIPYLQWSNKLDAIQHFDLQNSGIRNITAKFFSQMKTMTKTAFLNLADNNLKAFPKTLNATNFSKVYLAGNPIDCNCHMLWFSYWLNKTNCQSNGRIVKDFERVVCEGGMWNKLQVYKLSVEQMECYRNTIVK